MILQRAWYFLRRAGSNLRLNLFATSMNVFTLSASLVMLGVFYVLFGLVQNAVPSWLTDVKAVAYLRPEIGDREGTALARRVDRWPEVQQVDWVSKEAAWQRLKTQLSQWQDIFDSFEQNPLPASLEITFHGSHDPNADPSPIIEHLRHLPEVESVQTGRIWLDRFDSLLKLIKFVAGTIVLLVVLITVVIISNTVKLTIFTRLDELEIYRIIGAGPAFTKTPFYLEAILQGAMSAVLAMPPLHILFQLMHQAVPEPFVDLLPWTTTNTTSLFPTLTATGILLTCAGCRLALRRFLKA